jgi:nicotinic acid phosphoribosyltransferase
MRSILESDGYKFSMAEAGWPLREETFYYSQRKGGPALLPIDVKAFIKNLLPWITKHDAQFLEANEYSLGIGAQTAFRMHDAVKISALPKMSVFYPGEPVFSITGPSALVSWLEPLVLQINFQIQVATLAISSPDIFKEQMAIRNCAHEVLLIQELLDGIGVKAPPMKGEPDLYRESVLDAAKALVEAVGDPSRIFEVGLRSASCMAMHQIALEGCYEAGIKRTSNVWGADRLGMRPVGTMGHEHVMRYGNDEAAFRAMRDRRPFRSSYLLDTFDTFLSGIPTAFKVMTENPRAGDSIRYDSGNKEAQYLYAVSKAKEAGLEPVHILEDALDLEQTVRFEALRKQVGVDPGHQVYGYGGALVARPGFGSLHRDRVAAVYKLSQTGPKAVMKFGNEAKGGKISIPGRPVLWRRIGAPGETPPGIIAQEGERLSGGGYFRYTDGEFSDGGAGGLLSASNTPPPSIWSPGTIALRDRLAAEARGTFA